MKALKWVVGVLVILAVIAVLSPSDDTPTAAAEAQPAEDAALVAQMQAVEAALESTEGVRVEHNPSAMRVYVSALDMTDLEARQIAQATYDRIGNFITVYVYDGSGLERARANASGVE